MKTFKFIALGCMLLGSVSYGSSILKDTQLTIPFNDIVVNAYEMISAVKPANQYSGKTIMCSLYSVSVPHPTVMVLVSSSNISTNPENSHDGGYQIVGNNITNIYKFNVTPVNKNYDSYIRFSNMGFSGETEFKVSCNYQ